MTDALGGLSIVLFLLIAAYATAAETIVSRITRAKAHHLAQEKKKGARALVAIVEDPAPFRNAMLITKLLAHVGGTAVATVLALEHLEQVGGVVAVAAMTLLIFVVGEIVPKTYALQRSEAAGLRVARPVYLLGRLLTPVSKMLIVAANSMMAFLPGRGLPKGPFITEEEIRHLVDVAEEEEEIEEEERELIHSVFEFGDTVVREVMVPRPDMVTVTADASLDEALGTILKAGYSRVPIYEGDTDNIIGVLYAKDLLKRIHESKEGARVSELGRDPIFVPEQKKVAELLREMQNRRIHMAIVVDEYGGTAGLVTIEDLIEEIVGEIVDEYDQEEPLVEPIDENTIRVDAKMPIDEVNELLGADLPHDEWDTVGGLVFGLTGRVPAVGEKVRYDSLEFVTERVTGRRIQKVVITKGPAEADASEE
ncbi:MAG: hemolysin family protein [Actinomycetota bacterium]